MLFGIVGSCDIKDKKGMWKMGIGNGECGAQGLEYELWSAQAVVGLNKTTLIGEAVSTRRADFSHDGAKNQNYDS